MRYFYITFLLTVWGTVACWAQDEGEKEIVLKEVVVTATRAAKNLKNILKHKKSLCKDSEPFVVIS